MIAVPNVRFIRGDEQATKDAQDQAAGQARAADGEEPSLLVAGARVPHRGGEGNEHASRDDPKDSERKRRDASAPQDA